MEKFDGLNIKLESTDNKGMIYSNSKIDYLQKAIKAVCEIKLLNRFGAGFFCKIPYTEDENLFLPILITNDHVLSKELINSKNDIEIFINGETKNISIKQRKIWNDKEMDFTCIEIKEKEDNIHTFFNLDDNILDNNFDNKCYLNKNIIIFGINKNEKNVEFSNGLIIKNEECFFSYTCNKFKETLWGCIVNLSNNLLIGIHRGEIEIENKKVLNQGIFIRSIIKRINNNKTSLSLTVKNKFKIFYSQ